MALESLQELYLEQLKDLHSAEESDHRSACRR